MWDQLRPQLDEVDPIRVENTVRSGTPDVNYADGWIELKFAATWPKREATPLRLDHFTPQQRNWLRRRWLAGGRAFLFLKVGREWLLFDGLTAASKVGRVPRAELIAVALRHWQGLPKKEELLSCLLKPRRLSQSAFSSIVAAQASPKPEPPLRSASRSTLTPTSSAAGSKRQTTR